jgi:hypothetical protein
MRRPQYFTYTAMGNHSNLLPWYASNKVHVAVSTPQNYVGNIVNYIVFKVCSNVRAFLIVQIIFWSEKPGQRPLEKTLHVDGWIILKWTVGRQDKVIWAEYLCRALVNTVMSLNVAKFLRRCTTISFSRRAQLNRVICFDFTDYSLRYLKL